MTFHAAATDPVAAGFRAPNEFTTRPSLAPLQQLVLGSIRAHLNRSLPAPLTDVRASQVDAIRLETLPTSAQRTHDAPVQTVDHIPIDDAEWMIAAGAAPGGSPNGTTSHMYQRYAQALERLAQSLDSPFKEIAATNARLEG